MGFNFPNTPTIGDLYPTPALPGVPQYRWDGAVWTTTTYDPLTWVQRAGDTMTGALNVVTPPTLPAHAASKAYVDTRSASFDAMAYSGMQVNGSMEVSQENSTTQIVVGGTTAKYIIDGWIASTSLSTGQLTYYQASLGGVIPGLTTMLQFHVGTTQAAMAANDYARFQTHIEGWRFSRVAWGTAAAIPLTIGFWIRASLGGTYQLLVGNFDFTAGTGYIPFTVAPGGAFQWVTVTVPAQTTGVWKTFSERGATIIFQMASQTTPNLLATASNYASIAGVVVLPGIYAPTAAQSPLIMRPYDQELVTCQRYYRKLGGRTFADVMFFGYSNTNSVGTTLSVSPHMRATPAAAIFGTFTNINVAGQTLYPSVDGLSWQIAAIAAGHVSSYGNIGGFTLDARL